MNAFAAMSDPSNVSHGSQAGQDLQIRQVTQPRWSDHDATIPRTDIKPFAQSPGNYRFGDISKVTHN